MKEVKVSVILPSLNVVAYIQQCLESVMSQTLKDIEIICVDAGSTDGTLEIIQKYQQEDQRIRLIISDKKSYGYQMNLGIAAATGEYVGIVETDDYVLSKMYEELYLIAKKKNLDIVKSDFYRFTGNASDRVLSVLTKEKKYYNRVITPVDEQECFNFPLNTWSGIYKREFLTTNRIKHNETPGASYQDNGFWFQTFIYAKRLYFYDKPFYMNRRDNPGSSVFNKNKVYCICDEYEFIGDILRKDERLLHSFKHIYAYRSFIEHKFTLDRISPEYREAFLEKFAETLRQYQEDDLIDYGLFDEVDIPLLHSIMENPKLYYEQNFLAREQIYRDISKHKNIIIYGVGRIGKLTYNDICYYNEKADVVSFAVSDKKGNVSSYLGMPVHNIDDLLAYKENSVVVVATIKAYQKDIERKLLDLGFQHIILLPEYKG